MIRIISLSVIAFALLSCKGGVGDSRVFGGLGASFDSQTSNTAGNSQDAVLDPTESVIVDKGIDGGTIDTIGKSSPLPEDTAGSGKDTPTPPGKETPPPAKTPNIPDDLKGKLAKCYPQWDKGASGATYDIRQVNIDVDKLKVSSIQLTGDQPEVVFVNMTAASKIEKVKLSLENKKGLYCLDISADKIEHLDIAYICGAKLGLVDIEAGKAKKVNIKEFCNQAAP